MHMPSYSHEIELFHTDKVVNYTVSQALSKSVHLHKIVCSSKELTLLKCNSTRYSGNINDIQDAIVICQQRKNY